MAPHSSTLAWKIPWMEEPGGLQSMGSQRVGHDWATSLYGWFMLRFDRKQNSIKQLSFNKKEWNLQKRYSTSEDIKNENEIAQLCPTLCDPMDCSPSGFSIHGILQARVLEWVAISFFRTHQIYAPDIINEKIQLFIFKKKWEMPRMEKYFCAAKLKRNVL